MVMQKDYTQFCTTTPPSLYPRPRSFILRVVFRKKCCENQNFEAVRATSETSQFYTEGCI